MQAHNKEMTELFEALAMVSDAVSDEDRVVYLLASLPESFNISELGKCSKDRNCHRTTYT